MAAFTVALVGNLLGYFDLSADLTFTGWIVIASTGIVGLAFLVELGFRRGTPGPNRYGPDPLQR